MHKRLFCQNLLDNALENSIHSARKTCLSRFLSDLLDYDTDLSVTEIGKKLTSKTTVKSKIQAANYFVNNSKLERNKGTIYKGLAHFFWGHAKEIVVLIDWTGACSEGYFALKASVAAHGRSIPLYHEIHLQAEQEKPELHDAFLAQLKQIIPEHLSVTIITDAGFHRTWFEQVVRLGWDFIGRIYSRYHYQLEGTVTWSSVKDMVFDRPGKARALGKVKLGKTKRPMEGHLYSYKETLSKKIRKKKNKYPSHDKAFSNYYKNGWVIFSSLNRPANFLVHYYKKRMQIEQNFKDIKNERLGLGLRRNLSSGKTRISMLFFIACLLIMICWWFGLALETANLHRAYQANTVRNKRIRSFIHLARMALRHQPELLEWQHFLSTINKLQNQYHQFIECGVLN
jgi:hypothetical protein